MTHITWVISGNDLLNLSLVPDEDLPNWSIHKYCFDLASLDMRDNFATHKTLQKSTWISHATKWMLFWPIKSLSKPEQYSSRVHEHSWIYIDTHHRHQAEASSLLWWWQLLKQKAPLWHKTIVLANTRQRPFYSSESTYRQEYMTDLYSGIHGSVS